MRIALLEDNKHEADLLSGWLRAAGHTGVLYGSGKAFVKEVSRESFDLLIVGVRAAAMTSMEVLVSLHASLTATVPVLRVIEQDNEHEIVAMLKSGADDCMVTPLRRAEFLARVEVLGRRIARVSKRAQVLNYGNLSVDIKNRVVLRNGQRIPLTPKSYDLAVFLFSNLGQLMSRSYLMERIWGRGTSASTRTLDTHISRLRSDLGLTPENGWQLQSVYQHGYRLEQLDALSAAA